MRYETITVNPGELDTDGTNPNARFKRLNGWRGAHNRNLYDHVAKKLAKDAESASRHGILVLMADPDNPGTFFILDGQHRIYMASDYRTEPTTFEAQIRNVDDFDDPIVVQVEKLNLGTKFSIGAHLANSQAQSRWPDIFEEFGLDPTFNNGRSRLSWPKIMRARIAADKCARTGRLPSGTSNLANILEMWRTDDEDLIRDTAAILAWWETGASAAAQMKVYTLRSYNALAFAILLWEENREQPHLLEAPTRIARFNELPLIKGLPHSKVRDLFDLLIRGVNYKRKTRLLTILGDDGRGV